MIDFSKKKLIIFDLQQTLLNDFDPHLEAHRKILEEIGVENVQSELDKIIKLWGMRVSDVYRELFGDRFTVGEIQKLVEKREKYYTDIVSRSGAQPCDGAKNILRYLKSHNFKIAVSSGARKKSLELGLANSGLAEYIGYSVGAEDVEHGKPHPEPFLKAAEHFNVKPEECAVIGDSFLDIEAAKNANMYAIGVLTGFTSKEKLLECGADVVVDDLDELYKEVKR